MYQPKVTIVMATFNRAHFIGETLRSIQEQTFKDWECLIIDDGGTDNTSKVIAPFIEQDSRFQFLKRPELYKKGLPGSRNYGLDLAKGDYIMFFDDDDIVHPLNLELCVSVLCDKDFFFCRYLNGTFRGGLVSNFDLSKTFNSFEVSKKNIESIVKQELQFNSCSVMWRKNCFHENRFEEHLMYAEEWELYSRIISNGYLGVSIDKVLYFARKHENSNTAEFYRNDRNRKSSNADAIYLVVENLHKKQLINTSLVRFFILKAFYHKEFKLFNRIRKMLSNSVRDSFKIIFFYYSLPVRLFLHCYFKKKNN